TLVKCQLRMAARARPVNFASMRMSRRRAPSAARACLTGDVDKSRRLVLVVRNSALPRFLESRCARADDGSIGCYFMAEHVPVAGEVSKRDRFTVEHPEVVTRK